MLRFSVFVAGRFYAATTDRDEVRELMAEAALVGTPSVTVEVIA